MSLLITRTREEFEQRTADFKRLIAPYLDRLDACAVGPHPLASYIEASRSPVSEPLVKRYRRILMWPIRQLEYSFVLNHAPPGTVSRMLDAGAGITPLADIYAAAGAHATAVDGDPRLMDMMARDSIYAHRVDYSTQDITSLKFADDTFDLVTNVSVLEHLPRGLDTAAVREMLRVLKPGGKLLLTVDIIPDPIPEGPGIRLRHALKRVSRALRGRPAPPPRRTTPYVLGEVRERILQPFADFLEGPLGEPSVPSLSEIRRFWIENWVEGCGYKREKGRLYISAGLVLRKPARP